MAERAAAFSVGLAVATLFENGTVLGLDLLKLPPAEYPLAFAPFQANEQERCAPRRHPPFLGFTWLEFSV
jgi:hypothetical protein